MQHTVEQLDEVYEQFSDAVDQTSTAARNGNLQTHVRQELSPALNEFERLLDQVEDNEVEQDFREKYTDERVELFSNYGHELEAEGISRDEVVAAADLRRQVEYGLARELGGSYDTSF